MKNFILGASLVMVLLLLYLRSDFEREYCRVATDSVICFGNVEFFHNVAIFFVFILFFSLFTYKMPEIIFKYWWAYAKYAIPTILLLSIIINLEWHHKGTGGGFLSPIGYDEIDLAALMLLYSVFTLGSLIQIYRGWRHKKRDKINKT